MATVWNKCDGYAAPEGEGKIIGRVALTAATFGIVNAAPENNRPWAKLQGTEGIAACDEVLATSRIDSFPSRKLNVLRAHAIHNLEAKKPKTEKADQGKTSRTQRDASTQTRGKKSREEIAEVSRGLLFLQKEPVAIIQGE